MEYPQRKHPRLKEYDYSQNGAYFITICTKERMPLLGAVNAAYLPQDEAELGMRQICLSDAGQVCKRVLEDIPKHYVGVFLDCYVVMPDHIHMLLVLDDTACAGGQGSGRPTLQKILHAFKRISSKQAGVSLWQDSFYEHVVRNETDLKEIRQYIIRNPMKSTIGHSTPQGGQTLGRRAGT